MTMADLITDYRAAVNEAGNAPAGTRERMEKDSAAAEIRDRLARNLTAYRNGVLYQGTLYRALHTSAGLRVTMTPVNAPDASTETVPDERD